MVKVRPLGHLRSALQIGQANLNGVISDVRDLLNRLSAGLRAGEEPITSENTLIMVNGVEISALSEYDTALNPEDEVVLIPVVHGG